MLQKRLRLRLAGETVYDNNAENMYEVYKDLWKINSQRFDMIECGIVGENLRKLISKDDSGAKSGNAQKVSDALMLDIYGHRHKICLDKIIRDHGLYAKFFMNINFRYIITLPESNEVMTVQASQTLGTYTLKDLQLEYKTIENMDIASEIAEKYSIGGSLSYEHITFMKTVVWAAASTLLNENINIPRKSMKAIALLFTKQSRADSEEYIYPNITEVKLTIEGVPNSVYSQGIPSNRFYDEARRLFGEKEGKDQFMTVEKFYKDKFALVIDVRSHEEVNKTAHGKKIVNTQNGVLLEIKKKAHTGNINCNILVVYDGLVNFINKDLQSIQY